MEATPVVSAPGTFRTLRLVVAAAIVLGAGSALAHRHSPPQSTVSRSR
uniref:Uncharacterized protein n=1 Tax=uncultured Nocardioidaceae bacterium TaxID=253824 RepID=A0A6J4LJI4_9ACTN|nr:MAG: hypothetical protein AVDCRST_MAG46-1570 [uncultured Nocardioidaceae bacterium]